jgi:pimeloyl-ACP methyl ester carboxylesterase
MSASAGHRLRALHLRLLEGRAPFEALSSLTMWPQLLAGPRGDGHAVLVLPGLLADDASTELLRGFLRQRGWAPVGWGQGRNLGPRPGVLDAALQRLRQLRDHSGRKVSVVGQSLGGVYARLLASGAPDVVRLVVTLGSPIGARAGSAGSATRARRVYQAAAGEHAHDPQRAERLRQPLAVPSTSIYSRSDGVVPWEHSVLAEGAQCENIEVSSSHIGMGMHPAVLYALADRLLQNEGDWRPFEAGGALRTMYTRPARRH